MGETLSGSGDTIDDAPEESDAVFLGGGPDIRLGGSEANDSESKSLESEETGGNESAVAIREFLRSGRKSSGEIASAYCPWPYYTRMNNTERQAIVSYLETL